MALIRRKPAMFERPHHRRIARVLAAMDADLLREANCLFGGGTAMALRFGEYRESVDMDFLVSDLDSYRRLRQLLTGEAGFTREQVGKITVTDQTTYVAVARDIAREAVRKLSAGKVKGKTVKVRAL